ncbi:aldo/keto reductase [Streptomyces sp. NPDC048420]|uniref:aldo/keto reductase n=1 Tax=Streptomyces sp. NPDC048420 TaxID=3155755 RepID=UPI00342AB217
MHRTPEPDVPSWESDLTDLTDMPLAALESLSPLGRTDRLLEEVLRPRTSMRGGGEPGPARAE